MSFTLEEIKAERCRRSFYYFFLEFWDTIEAVEFKDNWHIKYICDELQAIYERWERGESQQDTIINVPPGSSKSTICTQLYPAWLWIKNPSIRIISSSYSATLSTAHAVKSRNCITSDKYQLYFSKQVKIKTGEDNKTNYKNTKMGERYVTSTGSAVTGMHADFILIDDPVNPEQAQSDAQRKAANDHIGSTLSTRKTDKQRTVTILIMQRLHEKDPTGVALKSGSVNHICIPGTLSKEVQPPELASKYVDGLMDPVRLGPDALAKLKRDLGSYAYAGQVMQTPSPEGGGQIKKAWFGKIGYDEFKKIQAGNPINFVLDTAYTEKQDNDPTAIMATCYVSPNLYILNSTQVWKEFPELLTFVRGYIAQHGYNGSSRIMVEPKASGKSVVQALKKTELNIFELPAPTDDKQTRVSAASPFMESGRVILVEGQWNDSFLGECTAFPMGEHDDQVDNLVNAIQSSNKNVNIVVI